jgi:hypothetical protein
MPFLAYRAKRATEKNNAHKRQKNKRPVLGFAHILQNVRQVAWIQSHLKNV